MPHEGIWRKRTEEIGRHETDRPYRISGSAEQTLKREDIWQPRSRNGGIMEYARQRGGELPPAQPSFVRVRLYTTGARSACRLRRTSDAAQAWYASRAGTAVAPRCVSVQQGRPANAAAQPRTLQRHAASRPNPQVIEIANRREGAARQPEDTCYRRLRIPLTLRKP